MDIKKYIRKIAGKIVGIEKYDNRINTAFYFINQYLDVTKAPKAEGALRDLQLCDYALLRILDKVCERNNLTYWLDYGTLLGAIRHEGFIPWDDDADVSMPREDFDRAKVVLKEAVEKYGIDVNYPSGNEHARLGFSYKHKETGIWIDIFPVDFVASSGNSIEEKEQIKKRVLKYAARFRKRLKKLNSDKVTQQREKYIRGEGVCNMMVHGMEFPHNKWIVIEKEKVVPCVRATFEGGQFRVPADYPAYLTAVFGKNYMGFPQSGLEHHGDERGLLSTWASKSNVDMREAYEKLVEIYEMI